ncbi:hypothetical protein D3C81_2045930 [compost metagenome]
MRGIGTFKSGAICNPGALCCLTRCVQHFSRNIDAEECCVGVVLRCFDKIASCAAADFKHTAALRHV